ncbi:MAG: UDP-N-acetylmuramoyl-tripeptide--D-alanyl-D-alanine ligase [Candidatus Gastranaerophilales bacterium]|nr:UDP-N-acetylmuramoyl-tripeptide--D-alanyl-D-alanine ligase [Candidatus Gastranaerophilales bacterium]
MMFKQDLIKASKATVLKDKTDGDKEFSISTDTRTITDKDIYLPLKGANFDGEKFIDSPGINAYFTTKDIITENADLVLKVKNTLDAYLKIAQYYRQQLSPIVIGITGSSGKTTTKEIIYAVLSQKFKTQKTFSNHNNEIGFCQTVLGMEQNTEVLIVEMGMRGLGEIELISKHLTPDFAVITNSGSAHVGRLGSLDNIAIAKCEITTGLNANGTLFALNQEIIKKHVKFTGEKIYHSINDVEILVKAPSYSKFEYNKKIYELNVEGDYNIENSLPAIELGYKLGMTYEEIKKGLASYHPIEKRWEVEEINGLKFINDSYNANPDSMKAAVKAFVELYPKPIVILGDMGELGEDEIKYHKEVGNYLAGLNKNVTYYTVGSLGAEIGKILKSQGFDVKIFNNNDEISCYILENLKDSYTIFLKASRSMKFEQILENLKKRDI